MRKLLTVLLPVLFIYLYSSHQAVAQTMPSWTVTTQAICETPTKQLKSDTKLRMFRILWPWVNPATGVYSPFDFNCQNDTTAGTAAATHTMQFSSENPSNGTQGIYVGLEDPLRNGVVAKCSEGVSFEPTQITPISTNVTFAKYMNPYNWMAFWNYNSLPSGSYTLKIKVPDTYCEVPTTVSPTVIPCSSDADCPNPNNCTTVTCVDTHIRSCSPTFCATRICQYSGCPGVTPTLVPTVVIPTGIITGYVGPPVVSTCICSTGDICDNTCTFENKPATPIKCVREIAVVGPTPGVDDKKAYCQRPRRTKGDANGDGLIDQNDYAIYLRASLSAPIASNDNPDFNGDGMVTPADLLILKNSIQL